MDYADAPLDDLDGQIAAVRRFNRFHTRLVGALDERLLGSEFSLPQMRVLYEIAEARKDAPRSASDLAAALRMDAGYLSRLVAGLEADGLVMRNVSRANARRLALWLSPSGRRAMDRLAAASAAEVAALLAPLSAAERRELVGAMARVRRLLGDGETERAFVLRGPEPGDLGMIVHRQAVLYAREYGWDWTFEALAAGIVADFGKRHPPERERAWVAERGGEIVGSVFVLRQDDDTAKLRLLYVDSGARGLGLGRRLVDESLRFARAAGYRRMALWTNDVLVSARRIYEAAGFILEDEAPHRSFGKDLIGQTWGRAL